MDGVRLALDNLEEVVRAEIDNGYHEQTLALQYLLAQLVKYRKVLNEQNTSNKRVE